jgi:hypothetical protein
MCGTYLRLPEETFNQLQQSPVTITVTPLLDEKVGYSEEEYNCLPKEEKRLLMVMSACPANHFFEVLKEYYELNTFLGTLPALNSIKWTATNGYFGIELENTSSNIGCACYAKSKEVQQVTAAINFTTEYDFLNYIRGNYPSHRPPDESPPNTLESHKLSSYIKFKQFLQEAAKAEQAVLFWIT